MWLIPCIFYSKTKRSNSFQSRHFVKILWIRNSNNNTIASVSFSSKCYIHIRMLPILLIHILLSIIIFTTLRTYYDTSTYASYSSHFSLAWSSSGVGMYALYATQCGSCIIDFLAHPLPPCPFTPAHPLAAPAPMMRNKKCTCLCRSDSDWFT